MSRTRVAPSVHPGSSLVPLPEFLNVRDFQCKAEGESDGSDPPAQAVRFDASGKNRLGDVVFTTELVALYSTQACTNNVIPLKALGRDSLSHGRAVFLPVFRDSTGDNCPTTPRSFDFPPTAPILLAVSNGPPCCDPGVHIAALYEISFAVRIVDYG